MSIFDPIYNYFRRAALDASKLEAQLDLVRIDRQRIAEASNDADTAIPKGYWLSGGSTSRQSDVIDPHEYYKTIENSQELYLWHATYGGCIDTLVRFVVGRGMKISPKMPDLEPGKEHTAEQTAGKERVEQYWQAVWEANGMDTKDKEIERRRLRDGDAILSFESADDGAIASMEWDSEELGTVIVPIFRILDPLRVRDDETEGCTYGVIYGADKETPVAYRYQVGNEIKTIPAEMVLHYKGKGDSDWPRGVPYLTRVLETARRHDRYQKAMQQRLELANSLVLHIGYENASAQNTAQAANLRTNSSTDNEQKRIDPGSILRTYGKTNVNMLSPSTNGAQADDERPYNLQFARAAGLAENSVSGDASNNNRASIEVAQDPQTSGVEDLQDDHANSFIAKLFRRSMQFGKAQGVLQASDPERCDIDPRPVVTRNMKEEADAMTVLSQHGLSDRTILAKLGFDPDREEAQKEIEVTKAVERNEKLGMGAPGADQDEEDEPGALKRQKAQEALAYPQVLEDWDGIDVDTLEGDTTDL